MTLAIALTLGIIVLGAIPAAGAKPAILKVDVAGSGGYACDGFDLAWSFQGWVGVHVFFNADGSVIREIDAYAQSYLTWENLATGSSLTTLQAGPNIYADGTLYIIGLNFVVHTGTSSVVLDVGRWVIDSTTGDTIVHDGPHDVASLGALCPTVA